MNEYAPYSNDLSDEDAKAGFILATVANPNGHFLFSPTEVEAVVHELDSNDRIIKVNNPITGGASYHHQRFGVFGSQPDSNADWLPVSSIPYQTGAQAVDAITSGKEAALQQIAQTDPKVRSVPRDTTDS